jgi:hypothetical protein
MFYPLGIKYEETRHRDVVGEKEAWCKKGSTKNRSAFY